MSGVKKLKRKLRQVKDQNLELKVQRAVEVNVEQLIDKLLPHQQDLFRSINLTASTNGAVYIGASRAPGKSTFWDVVHPRCRCQIVPLAAPKNTFFDACWEMPGVRKPALAGFDYAAAENRIFAWTGQYETRFDHTWDALRYGSRVHGGYTGRLSDLLSQSRQQDQMKAEINKLKSQLETSQMVCQGFQDRATLDNQRIHELHNLRERNRALSKTVLEMADTEKSTQSCVYALKAERAELQKYIDEQDSAMLKLSSELENAKRTAGLFTNPSLIHLAGIQLSDAHVGAAAVIYGHRDSVAAVSGLVDALRAQVESQAKVLQDISATINAVGTPTTKLIVVKSLLKDGGV
jgi:hypothetical protein